MKKIYIAGPLKGIEDNNQPAFEAAKKLWLSRGWAVFTPFDLDPAVVWDDRKALAIELAWIANHADAIYLLTGWEHSGGSLAEWALARRLKLEFFYES